MPAEITEPNGLAEQRATSQVDALRDVRELRLVNEIARIATLDLHLRPMLQRITDAMAEAFDWEFVACARIDHENNRFICQALTSRVESGIYIGYSRPLGSGVVGQVAQTGVPVLLDDVTASPNYVETLRDGAGSELCVPVVHRGRILAVLNLESPRPGAFSDQMPLMLTIADQVAGAIASAETYAELQLTNERLAETTARLGEANQQLEEANRQLEAANRELERQTQIDPLTRIANRRKFDKVLSDEWNRAYRSGATLGCLMIDVDHFKRFNDLYGHPAGDESLRRIAAALKESTRRSSDLVARVGGEEFAVLVCETDRDRLAALAEKLRRSVEDLAIRHEQSPGGSITVSVGAGVAVPADGGSPGELTSLADEALYRAKVGGRNRVEWPS